jgi:signal transduction histidine kinase/CheY-like chemotaxis protein
MTTLFTLEICYEQDIVQARQRTRELAERLGFDTQDQARLATAVSEIARNAFQHATGGAVEFYVEGAPQTFWIRVQDRGTGIPHLADVLGGSYTSPTGLGTGIVSTRRLMDSFEIESVPGQGTTVTIGKTLPTRTPMLTDLQLQQIRETVLGRSPQNPYEEIQRQNQELLRAMAELRKREEELTQLNQELEDTNRGVVALYAELDERADSLQKANELKTRFLSYMSHEFRTPLNTILSLSRILLDRMDGDLTPEQEKQVNFMQRAADGLLEMVDDLLDSAKVEAGKIEVYPSFFELSDLFGALRGMLRPLLARNSLVTLIFEEPHQLPQPYSDEGKVAQILRNFVSNALKFTQQGEVRVKASQTDSDIIFSVSDTGIGIAPKDQEQIFEDFVQIESSMQKQVKGTGLGLPLSRKLAELLGGRVSVESELGQGSTFSLSIPIADPQTTELPSQQPIVRLEPSRLPILAVADQPEALSTYDEYLQESRYRLISARTLAQAKQILQQLQPTVIVLDVLLEGQKGWTFLQEVKAEATTRNIPVLVATSIPEGQRAVALGADGFLIQPIDRLTLLHEINMLAWRVVPRKILSQKILLIDDDEASRYVVRQLLANMLSDNAPMEILEAGSGQKGLAIAQREQPTAIVLDLLMPEMSGFEVLDRLKGNPVTQSIPVIVRSSATLDLKTQNSLAERSVAVLSKETTSQAIAISQLRDALVQGGLALET